MRLDGIGALVTGGASGLGRATVAELVKAGASVVVADLATSPGEGVAADLGARFVPTDVLDSSAVEAAVAAAGQSAPLRLAVNCAGIATVGRVVGKNGPLPLAEFTRTIQINLVGTFNVVRLAAARISATEPVDGERGVIVNTASVAAYDGQVGQAAYAASKGAIASLTLPLARDLAPSLIRVMAIAPGIFDTPLMAGLPEAARTSLATQVPHPARFGDPREYAALVRHIVENPMLNGEVIRLDGAIRMAPR
jgi:NAD(P)-dependent dehydrogenase (short-subunit alcohol dehydrogenase family)